MANKAPIPKTQKELFNKNSSTHNRAEDVRRDNDTFGDLRIGLYDIDSCIKYYFDNIIKPTVLEDNEVIEVPAIYGSPERWVSVQRDGYYRDKDGKIQCPIIMFKRTALSKDRQVARNVLPDFPRVFQTFTKTYSNINRYDAFSKLTNEIPTTEKYNIIIPDYITLTYDCIIWTNYVEQLNKVIEAINYAESSYWGDPEKFEFYAVVNDFSNQTEVNDGQDRIVRCSFTITLKGYIISDALQKQIVEHTKGYSVQKNNININVGEFNPAKPYSKNKIQTELIPAIVIDDNLTQSLYPGQQYICQYGCTVYPANLINSDNTYSASFNPKNIPLYTLPDINITKLDGTTISYPSMKNYTYDIVTGSIVNSDNTYSASFIVTESFILPNITFTDSTGITSSIPAIKDIIATPQSNTRILEFVFPIAYDNNFVATIGTNQMATYTTSSLTNVNTIIYKKNTVVTTLPISTSISDTLEIIITRTNTALDSKVILNN